MKYENITPAVFLSRPNRFIAIVDIDGSEVTAHVKNTGRCSELLIPGAEVFLTAPGTPGRKTQFDLVAVKKSTGAFFNIDSQAPNAVVKEWLSEQSFGTILPEYSFGRSRMDFYMERGEERFLMEVKGCTLEKNGVGYFPDAPTKRGVKHVNELIAAKKAGFNPVLAFVIQTGGVTQVRPNASTHPEFAEAFYMAMAMGVKILFLPCEVSPDILSVCNGIIPEWLN